jgi:nucleoside-diphosphate-sugar epimerase
MASPNLLITGVTGFVGFRVLLDALTEGYVVRAAVRSSSQIGTLTTHPKVQAIAPGEKLSFVVVPDITQDDAYVDAVKGVTHIIHLASPLPSPALDLVTGIYEPAIKGVKSMLRAASGAPSVKKLVITSSVFGNMAFPPDSNVETTAESRVPDREPPFDHMLAAYTASKVAALNATDRFVKENKPSFDIVNVFPGFVFGPDDKALSAEDVVKGTNNLLVPIFTGNTDPKPPLPSGAAHVHDVAKVHILALRDGVVGDYGVAISHEFEDAWVYVKKHFPKEVEDGVFTQGYQQTVPVQWNAHKTETEFNFKFKTYEEITVDVAKQYLTCRQEEALSLPPWARY